MRTGARGLRALLPGRAVQGPPLRRLVRDRGAHHPHLLPAELPGPLPARRTFASTPPRPRPSRPATAACKRCRPDASPGITRVERAGRPRGPAMRLIADGTVDREGVTGLVARLGYSTRQLERLLLAEVGAGPLALARAQRAQTARLLIETTGSDLAEVAFGAGFASIRQFNETIREVFAAHAEHLARPAPSRRDAPPSPGRAHAARAVPRPVPSRRPLRAPRGHRRPGLRGGPRRRLPPHPAPGSTAPA